MALLAVAVHVVVALLAALVALLPSSYGMKNSVTAIVPIYTAEQAGIPARNAALHLYLDAKRAAEKSGVFLTHVVFVESPDLLAKSAGDAHEQKQNAEQQYDYFSSSSSEGDSSQGADPHAAAERLRRRTALLDTRNFLQFSIPDLDFSILTDKDTRVRHAQKWRQIHAEKAAAEAAAERAGGGALEEDQRQNRSEADGELGSGGDTGSESEGDRGPSQGAEEEVSAADALLNSKRAMHVTLADALNLAAASEAGANSDFLLFLHPSVTPNLLLSGEPISDGNGRGDRSSGKGGPSDAGAAGASGGLFSGGSSGSALAELVAQCTQVTGECGAAGGWILDAWGRTYSKGIGFNLGAFPASTSSPSSSSYYGGNWWETDTSATDSSQELTAETSNVPVPYLIGRDMAPSAEKAVKGLKDVPQKRADVRALSSLVTLVPRRTFEELGGFSGRCDESPVTTAAHPASVKAEGDAPGAQPVEKAARGGPPLQGCTDSMAPLSGPFVMIDWCLRAADAGKAIQVAHTSSWQFFGEAEELFIAKGDSKSEVRSGLVHVNSSWGYQLRSAIESAYDVGSLGIVWNSECGTGQVMGFTTEMIGFMLALDGRVPLKLEISDIDGCMSALREVGLPARHLDMLERLARVNLDDMFLRNSDGSPMPRNETTIALVIHRDPGRYSSFISSSVVTDPDLIIGRSMFESDTIPWDWTASCNSEVDQIWVPSHFNVDTFSRAGVNASLLVVVGEAVDIESYVEQPELQAEEHSLLQILEPFDGLSHAERHEGLVAFEFLTVMKWEDRKAWDTLLTAYFQEFANTTEVSLNIRSSLDPQNWREFDDFVTDYLTSACSEFENDDREKLEECVDGLLQALPVVHVIREKIPYTRMPDLYASADCLVLATHGEGWGLPLAEAMAMGVPVIATNWSGTTEFMTEENSLLVPVSGLVQHPSLDGHSWAQPSVAWLRYQMRRAFEARNTNDLFDLTRKSISDMTTRFSPRALGSRVIELLAELRTRASGLRERRQKRQERSEARREAREEQHSRRIKVKINDS